MRALLRGLLLGCLLLAADPVFSQDVWDRVEHRYADSNGVKIHYAVLGEGPLVVMIHGFPDFWYTWRHQMRALADHKYRVAAVDLRGYDLSDKPKGVENYAVPLVVGDIAAVVKAEKQTDAIIVGHDWGGAVAWAAAMRGDRRLERLAIVNSPHPVIFQKSLIEDEGQRAASQYINAFKTPGFEKAVEAMGFETFFEKSFSKHVDLSLIPEAEKRQYIADWSQPGALTAMLNWYRASRMIVPPPGITVPLPDLLLRAFPRVKVPTLVVWGMLDRALLPLQLDGLDALVDDLTIVRLPDIGHFAPWEAGEQVGGALRDFLTKESAATAPAA